MVTGKDIKTIVTWIVRLLIGGLFLFSGFTKAIDVWGTIYKFNEYFSVWGYEVWDALNTVGVFTLCLVEFLTGFFLIFGCFRRATPVIALLIMAFMLPLTLWLAVKNPIADCGCFGDALKLTNWQTFFKNVILTAGAVWLLIYNFRLPALINPYLQWIATIVAGAYILIISWIGYYYQPLIDFRPYKTGTELVDAEDSAEEYDEDAALRFVYEKNGERKEFTIDDELPSEDEGWTFVERYTVPNENDGVADLQPALTTTERTIRIFTEDGREDVTEEVVGSGDQLLLMISRLADVTPAKTWKINSLYQWCVANNIEMIAIVGGNPVEIDRWKDLSLAEYPIYTADDTAIEEVVRGNPGIVFLEDGVIRWKSSLRALDSEDFREEGTSDPMTLARDDSAILRSLSWIFIGITALLVMMSMSPKIVGLLTRRAEKRKARKTKKSNKTPFNKADDK